MVTELTARVRAAVHALLGRSTAPPRHPDTSRIPFHGRTRAGIYVDADRALTHDVVWACVRYLTQSVGKLPWRVMRPLGEGGERQPRHPVDRLLHRRPNPEWSSFAFRETLLGWAVLRGNGYAEIERDALRRPVALWPLHPDRVDPMRNTAGRLFYRVDNEGAAQTDIDATDMFHVRGFGDDVVGLNVVQYAAQSIGWAQATQMFGSTFFGEGMNPSGIVQTKKALSPEAKEILRADMEELYKGPRRANRTAILDAEMEWKQVSSDPEKAQFVTTMQHQVEMIARWFGVPPHKVMHLLRSTNNNIEHQSIEVVVDSISPWCKRFEDEADAKLFGMNPAGLYTKINMNALMRGDSAARATYYQQMRNAGVLSVDEIRALEDMNPLGPEKGGDKHVMQGQYTTLDQVGANRGHSDG